MKVRLLLPFALALLALVGCERLFSPSADERMPPLPDSLRLATGARVDYLSTVIRADEREAEAFFRRAKLRSRQGDFVAASESIRRAVALDSASATYRYWQAVIAAQEGNYPAAARALEKARSLGFREKRALPLEAEVYFRTGRPEAADLAARRAEASGYGGPKLDFVRGSICRERGEPDKAERLLRKALAADSAFTEASVELVALYRERGQNDSAEAVLRNALAFAPQAAPKPFARLAYQTARLLQDRRQGDSAAFWLDRAVLADDSLWQAQVELAERDFARRRYEEGTQRYEKALSVNPRIEEGYYRLGFIYEYYVKDLNAARRAYGYATRYEPENGKAQRALRRVEYKINRPEPPPSRRVESDSV